jgi:hypothetical protein
MLPHLLKETQFHRDFKFFPTFIELTTHALIGTTHSLIGPSNSSLERERNEIRLLLEKGWDKR